MNMSFLDDNKTAGIAFIILGVLQLIAALATLVGAVTAKDGVVISAVVACLGPIIMAVLYFRFGVSIKNGSISKKIDILAYFVRLAGLSQIILSVFSFWHNWELEGGIAAVGGLIISIIIGLIILFIAGRINDGKQDTGDKIIWIILVVLFVIAVIGNLISLVGVFALDVSLFDKAISFITVVVNLIINLFMLVLLFNSDVKREMNM